VCIVTVTWSRLFLVMLCGLSVRLGRSLLLLVAQVGNRHWCVSSYFVGRRGNTWLYSQMWCPGVLPLVKLHALRESVVPTGVTILLGLCNPPHRGCGEPAKLGFLYPLCGFLVVV
jgi:hypothetical protein